jgi:hypothetical protein
VLRQAALDVVALAAAVRRGVDVDGDGSADLSSTRVGYYGQSFGAIYGRSRWHRATTAAWRLERRRRPDRRHRPVERVVPAAARGAAARAAAEYGKADQRLHGGEPLYGRPPRRRSARGAMAIDALLADARGSRARAVRGYAPALRDDPRVCAGGLRRRDRAESDERGTIRAGAFADRTGALSQRPARRTPHAIPTASCSIRASGRPRGRQDQALDFIERRRC